MNEPGIAERLKALREAADPPLSVGAVARYLGRQRSSYYYYEDTKNFKKPYLPPDLAQNLAVLFAQHGIDPGKVLALGGVDSGRMEKLGLRENEVEEYRAAAGATNGEAAAAARIQAAAATLVPGRPHASLWRIRGRALELAGYRRGDVVVADPAAEPESGDAVVARIRDWQGGTARTVLRLYQPPYHLVTAAADPSRYRPELVDNDRVTIKAVVIALIRARETA